MGFGMKVGKWRRRMEFLVWKNCKRNERRIARGCNQKEIEEDFSIYVLSGDLENA